MTPRAASRRRLPSRYIPWLGLLVLPPLVPGAALGRAPVSPRSPAAAPCQRDGRGLVSTPSSLAVPAEASVALLSRALTLDAGETSLREALDLVARAARARLSYSADLLPLERRVCATWRAVSVADALAELLAGTALQPVMAGTDHIVLAPFKASAATSPASRSEPLDPVIELEEILVSGAAPGIQERGDPYARSVLSGRLLEQRPLGTLGDALSGTVPGLWMWKRASGTASYGSLRGASSFGVSAPKVYIDGIEVANPLLVTRFLPEVVSRVEVIRGPQGSGLYGSDAISGVMNITTRRGTLDGRRDARVQSRVGVSGGAFTQGGSLSQEHAISLFGGREGASGGISVALGSAGDFVPGAASRHVALAGMGRVARGGTVLDATLLFSTERAGTPRSPLLAGLQWPSNAAAPAPGISTVASSDDRSVTQYTAGATASFLQGEQWSHFFTLGVDGYALSGGLGDGMPFPSAADSALLAARGSGFRSTVRLTSVGNFVLPGARPATLTLTADHWAYRQRSNQDAWRAEPFPAQAPGSEDRGRLEVGARLQREPWEAAARWGGGMSGRFEVTPWSRLVLSGGVRFERAADKTGGGGATFLPMLGASWVERQGPVSLKLRGAHGRAVRWPQLVPLGGDGGGVSIWAPALGPELQSGVEAGVDVGFGHSTSLHITRFDQTASGLLQRVPFAPAADGVGLPPRERYGHRLEKVGEISNRGWEVEGSWSRGPLALSGTLSLVDSRVRRLAEGYEGDLRAGDRMLGVPALTTSLTAAWSRPAWSLALSGRRARDWTDYDRQALAEDVVAGSLVEDVVGEQLRAYWKGYPGVTHLGLTLTRQLHEGVTLTLAGDNLLNHQLGEPDNLTVLPGRTLSLGVRARF